MWIRAYMRENELKTTSRPYRARNGKIKRNVRNDKKAANPRENILCKHIAEKRGHWCNNLYGGTTATKWVNRFGNLYIAVVGGIVLYSFAISYYRRKKKKKRFHHVLTRKNCDNICIYNIQAMGAVLHICMKL